MARPLEYTPEVIDKVNEYLEECVDEDKQSIKYESEKSTGFENKLIVKIPTIEGLAVYLNVHKSTIYDWESRFTEFSDVIAKLRSIQADRLINNGLSGDYNPTIAKVLLTKHGYREGVENTGKDGTPLVTTTPSDTDIEEIAKRVSEELKNKILNNEEKKI